MNKKSVFVYSGLFALCLLLGFSTTTHAQLAATISILEPIENGVVVYQNIAPSKIGTPAQGRISMLMNIQNSGIQTQQISKIVIAGQTVATFAKVSINDIALGQSPHVLKPGQIFQFQNATPNAVILNAPLPASVKVQVYFHDYAQPIEISVNIKPHQNEGGPLLYPGKISDLRTNETWGCSSDHGSGHQVFALDMGVKGWSGSDWTETYAGKNGVEKENYRIYGMPVYAMAAGTVCWALNDQPERPTTASYSKDLQKSKSLGVYYGGGNQIFIKTGSEVAVYAHLQPGSIPAELLVPGATVKKGQYLGKVGLTGDSSHPHIHIHVKEEPGNGAPSPGKFMNNCDAGYFRPMSFTQMQNLNAPEAKTLAAANTLNPSHWYKMSNHSASHTPALLYPSFDNFAFNKNATDSKQYLGVWRSSNEIEIRVKLGGWSKFTQKWQELSNDNFRLVEIETFVENNERQFMGVFKRMGGKYALYSYASWESFLQKRNELAQTGHRLVDLATFTEGNTRYYVGVFLEGNDKHNIISLTGWTAFTQKWDQLSKDGYRLVDVETFPVGNDRQYIGVFREGNYGHYLYSITGWSAFTAKWDELSKNGLRLVDVETFGVGNNRQFVGVFRQGTGGYSFMSVTGYTNFTIACEKANGNGMRLVDVHVEQ